MTLIVFLRITNLVYTYGDLVDLVQILVRHCNACLRPAELSVLSIGKGPCVQITVISTNRGEEPSTQQGLLLANRT